MKVVNKEKDVVLVRDTQTGDIYHLQPGDNEFNEEVAQRLVKHKPDYETFPELKAAHRSSAEQEAPEKVDLGSPRKGNVEDAL